MYTSLTLYLDKHTTGRRFVSDPLTCNKHPCPLSPTHSKSDMPILHWTPGHWLLGFKCIFLSRGISHYISRSAGLFASYPLTCCILTHLVYRSYKYQYLSCTPNAQLFTFPPGFSLGDLHCISFLTSTKHYTVVNRSHRVMALSYGVMA